MSAHTLMHTHTHTPRTVEDSWVRGTRYWSQYDPLGNKDRPRLQKEWDEATGKTHSRAPTQSHLYLLSPVSRAMAGGSVFLVDANPLRGEKFGLDNKMLWGGKCSITESFFLFVPKISQNIWHRCTFIHVFSSKFTKMYLIADGYWDATSFLAKITGQSRDNA